MDRRPIQTGCRAVTKLATKRQPAICRACGKGLTQSPTGRPRLCCSNACRQDAWRHKKSPAVYHRHQRDEWATPRDRFAEWSVEFGPFTLDAAATTDNALYPNVFTIEDDGLAQHWGLGPVWCNPPYSAIAKWVRKAYEAAQAGATVVMLVPVRTDTRWWHEWATRAEIQFLNGPLRFGDASASVPFPSALLIFRP